jgi:fatty acid desaturase
VIEIVNLDMFFGAGDIAGFEFMRHVLRMETERVLQEEIKINWYRSPIDKAVMSQLMKKSDAKALIHVLLHLGLFILTATICYLAFLNVNATNWMWAVPLLLFCLFWHGTFPHFLGGTACHELSHKTPFRTQSLNDFFLYLFSFLTWFDPIGYRLSHVKHHQVTVHHDLDGEVILPQKLDWSPLQEGDVILPEKLDGKFANFIIWHFLPFPHPESCWQRLNLWIKYAVGDLKGMGMFAGGEWWLNKILPESKVEARRRHANWARVVLLGHLALAVLFIATGHWFLVILVSCSGTYAGWLSSLCSLPQHIGMGPDVPDFRLCCRTYTCHWFPAFLYWNMQYHVEHHMFPAVPFYNLPALRKAIENDLPPATNGLLATWRQILPVLRKQGEDRNSFFVPALPHRAV